MHTIHASFHTYLIRAVSPCIHDCLQIQLNTSLVQEIKSQELPEKTSTPGLRPMRPEDVPQVWMSHVHISATGAFVTNVF